MFKYKHAFVALCQVLLVIVPGCNAPDQDVSKTYPGHFLEFLSYIPNNKIYHQWVTYGDLSAWFDVWNIERPASGDLRELESSDFIALIDVSVVIDRQTHVPQSFSIKYSAYEDQVELPGFNFLVMDRYMVAGYPPQVITLAEFSFDKSQITESLTKLGYQSDKTGGGVLYSIRNDNEPDFNSPTRSIWAPDLNRIFLTDDRMVIGWATQVVKNAQSAHSGNIPSLAENATYVAMSQVLESDALSDFSEMVGVILVNGSAINESVTRSIQEAPDSQNEGYFQPPLPVFDLAGFATFQKDKTTFLTLILIFPEDKDAQSAVDILAERLQNYTTIAAKEPFGDWWSVEKATAATINDLPVAIVVMRAEGIEFQSPRGNNLGVLTWNSLVLKQDFLFLKTEP